MPPRGGGGGGYCHIYAYWVCAARETPIFSPNFPIRSISFSQNVKIFRSGVSPFYNFFAVQDTIIFEISLRSSHLSPPTAGLLSQTPRARSGAPHFDARARSRAPCFSLCRGSPGLAAGIGVTVKPIPPHKLSCQINDPGSIYLPSAYSFPLGLRCKMLVLDRSWNG